MRVSIINFSARRRGNSELLSRLLGRWCRERDLPVTAVSAAEAPLSPCNGCMACVFRHPGRCVVEDSLPAYLEAMQAERMFLVGPVYFLTPASGWKLLLDRMLAFRPSGEAEKHCGIFHLAGLSNWSVADPLAALVGLAAGYQVSGARTLTGPGPGHALLPDENLEEARRLFERVLAGEQELRPGFCNICLSAYLPREKGWYCPICDAMADARGLVPRESSRWHPRRLERHYREWVAETRALFLRDRPRIRKRLQELDLLDLS